MTAFSGFRSAGNWLKSKNPKILLTEILLTDIPIKRLDGLQAVPKLKNCAVKVLHSLNLSQTLDRVDIRRN